MVSNMSCTFSRAAHDGVRVSVLGSPSLLRGQISIFYSGPGPCRGQISIFYPPGHTGSDLDLYPALVAGSGSDLELLINHGVPAWGSDLDSIV